MSWAIVQFRKASYIDEFSLICVAILNFTGNIMFHCFFSIPILFLKNVLGYRMFMPQEWATKEKRFANHRFGMLAYNIFSFLYLISLVVRKKHSYGQSCGL